MRDRGMVVGHGLSSAALWLWLGAAQVLASAPAATLLLDLRAAALQGPRSWEALRAWGPRLRWRGDASADRQRLPDACGPAALCAVLRRRGTHTTQELLWSLCRRRGGGTTLGRLARSARRLGQPCEARYGEPLETLPLPAVLHLRRKHFVVLQRVEEQRAEILDPACGLVVVPVSSLRRQASGAALIFPSERAAPRLESPASGGTR